MASRHGRGSTDHWEHKRLTLPDGSTLAWTVDPTHPDGPTVLSFMRMVPTEGMRALRQAGHPDGWLRYFNAHESYEREHGLLLDVEPGPFDEL